MKTSKMTPEEFQRAFLAYCTSQNINYDTDIIKEDVKDIKSSDPDSISFHDEDGVNVDEDVKQLEKKGKPEQISKLFKQIATKTHPDKFANAEKRLKSSINRCFCKQKRLQRSQITSNCNKSLEEWA